MKISKSIFSRKSSKSSDRSSSFSSTSSDDSKSSQASLYPHTRPPSPQYTPEDFHTLEGMLGAMDRREGILKFSALPSPNYVAKSLATSKNRDAVAAYRDVHFTLLGLSKDYYTDAGARAAFTGAYISAKNIYQTHIKPGALLEDTPIDWLA